MKKIFVLIFLIAVQNCLSQKQSDTIFAKIERIKLEFEDKIKSFKDSLTRNNIAIATYEEITGGNAFTFSIQQFKENPCSCIEPKIINLFWFDKGKTFGKRFDYCLDYKTIYFKDSKAWNFILSNEAEIEEEKIKPFEYNDGDEIFTTFITHQKSQELNFEHDNKKVHKVYHELNFVEKYESKTNLNWIYNNNLKSKKILDLLVEMSKKLNTLENKQNGK